MGFLLWAYALARMDVGRATTALYLVPAAAILIALVWLGQVPSPVELIGGVIALAGVVLAREWPSTHASRRVISAAATASAAAGQASRTSSDQPGEKGPAPGAARSPAGPRPAA